MRTLDELYQIAKEAEERYASMVSDAEMNLDEAKKAVAEAEKKAAAALACGDSEAYTKANHDAEYNRRRAVSLSSRIVEPLHTPKEHNAIIDEINNVVWAEERECYKRLHELRQEWEAVVSDLRRLGGRVRRIDAMLFNTGIPSGMRQADYHNAPVVFIDRDVEAVGKSTHLDHVIGVHCPKRR